MVNYYLIPLYFFFLSRAIIWFLILRNMQLVKAYTFSSINYLFIPFLSHFLLGEDLHMKHLYGGLFIVVGIVVYRIGEERRKS
jgi:drug/metabolite transporter (DMT)-like permease